jgi:hypothetical protein
MNHLSDEQLTDAYYGEPSGHLETCEECRGRLAHLRQLLDAFHEFPIPRRAAGHGAEMWTRVLAKLPAERPKNGWLRWWVLAPAFASLLLIAFFAGRLSQVTRPPQPQGISETARERVLLMSLSDHLERSQIVLANVANAEPGSADLADERDRARELLGANRLLRQTAARLGDETDAALLEELERVLLDVANSPDLAQTQRQIDRDGLLFKVRVTSVSSRERGEKL